MVGPFDLKSDFKGLTVARAFSAVAARGLTFVSRGDGSGTNEKELSIWAAIGVDPTGSTWYLETGQGMGPTIQVADQRSAITLAEYGAFASAAATLSSVNLEVAPEGLTNPYTGYVVAGSTHEGPATEFLRWLVSPEGARVIAEVNEGLFGEVIYQSVVG
jgi:tungstate transport system substrate-binding protein